MNLAAGAQRYKEPQYKISMFHQNSHEFPPQTMPCPFRFLELPKELRLMVYERVPRTIHHRTIQLCRPDENDKPHTVLTLIIRSIPMSLLAVSRQVYLEANPILHGIADNFILNSVPRFIYENEELFNPDLIEWLLICIAGQTQVHSELHKGSASRDLSQGTHTSIITTSPLLNSPFSRFPPLYNYPHKLLRARFPRTLLAWSHTYQHDSRKKQYAYAHIALHRTSRATTHLPIFHY